MVGLEANVFDMRGTRVHRISLVVVVVVLCDYLDGAGTRSVIFMLA